MLKALLTIMVSFICIVAFAAQDFYEMEATRDGERVKRVTYNKWAGEYPTPVVNVTKGITVDAHHRIGELERIKKCTIKDGIYHPWSKTGNSTLVYYTLTKFARFEVQEKMTLESLGRYSGRMRKGDVLTLVHGRGEDICKGILIHKVGRNKKRYRMEFFCSHVFDNTEKFKPIYNENERFFEQWLYVRCKEGYKAFIQDMDLLSQPNVEQGDIIDYGIVGPKKAKEPIPLPIQFIH